MTENNSPWLYQLARTRPEELLKEHLNTDVLIVGGGIAGISTLFYTLKNTNRNVVLLEAHRVAHGATGHNAGYVIAEFEKPFKDIIAEHGKDLALEGIRSIRNSWQFLEELLAVSGGDIPRQDVTSYGGYSHFEQFRDDLEDAFLSEHPFPGRVLIAEDSKWLTTLPENLAALCEKVPREEISDVLGTTETVYDAAIPGVAVVLNSALLTERILLHCLEHYKDRVTVFENSPVHGLELDQNGGKAFCGEHTVTFKEVVLATNGFENFYIKNNHGREIDSSFHHHVKGVVGYMTGYLTKEPVDSIAKFYYPSDSLPHDPKEFEPYFYLTRRDFAMDTPAKLISVGGPEVSLEDREEYFREYDVAENIYETIDNFVKTQRDPKHYERKFRWHGLMGYTTSGLRLVGREPANEILLYNLGCNGVGILTSIFGGTVIAKHLNGEAVAQNIFTPKGK